MGNSDGRPTAGNRSTVHPVAGGRPSALRWIKPLVSLAILAATGWFLSIHLQNAWQEFRRRDVPVDLRWAVAGGVIYILGMLLLGIAWHLVLRDRSRRDPNAPRFTFLDTSRAFLISQLGKYVPGKAMVLVIRYALLSQKGMTVGMATLTSFYETFCTMATGSAAATMILLFALPPAASDALETRPYILPMAIFVALGFLAAVMPPVFSLLPRLVSTVARSARRHGDDPIAWSTFAKCLAVDLAGWAFLGTSFWATARAVSSGNLPIDAIPAFTAAFALSFVAGFVSMIPGQLFVREAILMLILVPLLAGDELVAAAAAILSRLVTLLAELFVGGSLFLTFRLSSTKLPSRADAHAETR